MPGVNELDVQRFESKEPRYPIWWLDTFGVWDPGAPPVVLRDREVHGRL